MTLLRKLLKWLLVLVVAVAILGLLFVWIGLGVNPFEGKKEHLWELVSNEVDFFVRFPGSQVLDEPLTRDLEEEPGFGFLLDLRQSLTDLTRDIAREVNPQVPLGLVEVDFEQDFVGREMAFAGTMRNDFAQMRVDNFIVLTRIAGYGRFISALKRDFVRNQLPDGDRIKLVKGYYFEMTLDAAAVEALAPLRSGVRGRSNSIYFGRIADVLIISDEPAWIEAALREGHQTLPADPWFETEFMRKSRRKGDIELFMRPILSANLLMHHGRDETGGPLAAVRRMLPVRMTGEVTVRATPERDGVAFSLSNNPPPDGFKRVQEPYLQKLYQREKVDLAYELSENGIARFIPSARTVGAIVVAASGEELVGTAMAFIPAQERDLFSSEVAKVGPNADGRRFTGLEDLLRALTEDFADTHMVILHRPSVFEGKDYATFKDPPEVWPGTPKGQFYFTLISRVRDNVAADAIRRKITEHLKHLQLEPASPAVHKSGKFHLAVPIITDDDTTLIQPAYGAMTGGMKYFVFSSNPEAAAAVYRAAEDPQARLIGERGAREALARLPSSGSLAIVLRGEEMRDGIWDRVRQAANDYFNIPSKYQRWRQDAIKEGLRDEAEIEERLKERGDNYIRLEYPDFRERYRNALEWLGSIDTIAVAATFGIGPTKEVRAQAYVTFRLPEDEEPTEE